MGLMPAKFIGLSYLLVPRLAIVAGLLLLGLIVYVAAVRLRVYWQAGDSLSLGILSLIAFGLSFAALTAVGRVCTGLYASGSSRYMTLVVPLFAALFLHFSFSGARIGKAAAAFIACLAIGGYMPVSLSGRASLAELVKSQREWRDCYLQTENVRECHERLPGFLHPDPEGAGLHDKLQFLKERRLNLYAQ